jgi:mannose-1-phosphate guanylyltransferase / phosphomannomutase
MGRPVYGFVADGYWQDIGNLTQYRQANFDALDEQVQLEIPGIRFRGNVWIGEGVEIDDFDRIEAPAFVGNYCRIAADATVGPYSVLSASVTLRDRARTVASVIDASTHIGRSALIENAIVGRSCDIRSHVRIHEEVAIGDEVAIGAESVVMPGVRIFPFKEVESGSQVFENLVFESRAAAHLFSAEGVAGLVNVDLTPETALRLAASFGTALKRGARVVASREAPAACRMLKRAMISGLTSTGVEIADLRVLPAPVGRHLLKSHGYDGGLHVGISSTDPEVLRIALFEPPGIELSDAMQKEVEKHFTRLEFRRMAAPDVGGITYPARAREGYADDLLAGLDVQAIRARAFKIVIDYGYSAASFVLPLLLGPLGIEAVGAHAFRPDQPTSEMPTLRELVGQAKRLVSAVGADLGVVFDRAAERLYLIDDQAREIPVEQALLLYLRLISSNGQRGKLAFPVTVTSQVDRLVQDSPLEIVRTPASLPALTKAAAEDGVIFAGAVGGGYLFPEFLPAYDAMASLCKLLELLGPINRPLSELVSELPESHVVHRRVPCPWAQKGLVMRVLTERLRDRDVDLSDGVKVFDERGWAQVLPDPDEPVVHVYAEGSDMETSAELERELREVVETVLREGEEVSA